jgi:hypothetical protein
MVNKIVDAASALLVTMAGSRINVCLATPPSDSF